MMDPKVIEGLEKMAETSPQVGMLLATMKFEDRQRSKGKMPTKGFGDKPGSINDLGEHWPSILSEPDEEYLAEDKKYYELFLEQQAAAKEADGDA